MCYQMIPLATYNDQHFIGQCEHGMLHLNWGRLVTSFHASELLIIARTLHRYDPDSRDPLISPSVSLLWNDQDTVQIWLMRVGLLLCADALAVLLSLIAQAYQVVTTGSTATFDQQQLTREQGYRPLASPN